MLKGPLGNGKQRIQNTGKKVNNQSFEKRKVKNSKPISQIKRNYAKVKKTAMSVAQCAKMQYQIAQTVSLPTTDSYDLQAQKNEHNVISMINLFHNNFKCGPECTCCDQLWYKSSVVKCDVIKYKVCSQDLLKSCVTGLKSVDNAEWICTTCDLNLKKGRLPSCSKANKMSFPKKPELLNFTSLEERLVSPRIPFMLIHELPRGGQLTIHGNIVNVPSDVNSTVHYLPRLMDESETIPIKLTRRLSYKHNYQFQNVRPKKVLDAVKYLVGTSDLFKHEGIEVQNSWLGDISSQCSGHEEWTEFVQNHVTLLSANLHAETDETVTKDKTQDLQDSISTADVDNAGSIEDDSDGWCEVDERPSGSTDTLLQEPDVGENANRVTSFAPGEGNKPFIKYIYG